MYHYRITDRSKIVELARQSLPVNEEYGVQVIVGSPVRALQGETFSQ